MAIPILSINRQKYIYTKLEHQLNPKPGELTLEKNPLVFLRLLEYHRFQEVTVFSKEVI